MTYPACWGANAILHLYCRDVANRSNTRIVRINSYIFLLKVVFNHQDRNQPLKASPPSRIVDMNTPLEQLCCLAANPYPTQSTLSRLTELCSTVDDWSPLEQLVKKHRIASLLYWHHTQGYVTLPKAQELQLASWFIRNKKVATVRDAWLTLLSNQLDEASIRHAYLKGTALCHLIYPSPYIRSMDDIDILVDPRRSNEVYDILKGLGVSAKKPTTPKELGCHQWPIATLYHEGIKFDLEIHTRVLSRRIGGYGVMNDFSDSLVPFDVGQQTRYALSHEDFLITQLHRFKHLTEIFRLIDITDIAAYLECYATDMNWHRIYEQHSWIQNCLMAIDCVTPLTNEVKAVAMIPDALAKHSFNLNTDPYAGLPVNRYLLARGLHKELPLSKRIANTLLPSLWWMTLVYGTSPNLGSRLDGYALKHPVSVIQQLYNATFHK